MREYFDEEEINELASSIESAGLINPIVVCRMDETLAKEYLAFTNNIWRRQRSFADFVKHDDGHFLVLIAGERRLRAMERLDQFRLNRSSIEAKVYQIESPADFPALLKFQAAENLHEKPSAYRFAVSVYTLYKLGNYNSVSEFIKKDGSAVGEKRARNAINFFSLPDNVRSMTEKGVLSYSTAIELASYKNTLTKELRKLTSNTPNTDPDQEDEATQINEYVAADVFAKALLVVSRGLSNDAVRGLRKSWVEELRYFQPDFFGGTIATENDCIKRLEQLTVRTLKDIAGEATRALRRSSEAFSVLLEALNNGASNPVKSSLAIALNDISDENESLVEHFTAVTKHPIINELGSRALIAARI